MSMTDRHQRIELADGKTVHICSKFIGRRSPNKWMATFTSSIKFATNTGAVCPVSAQVARS